MNIKTLLLGVVIATLSPVVFAQDGFGVKCNLQTKNEQKKYSTIGFIDCLKCDVSGASKTFETSEGLAFLTVDLKFDVYRYFVPATLTFDGSKTIKTSLYPDKKSHLIAIQGKKQFWLECELSRYYSRSSSVQR